MRSPGLVGLGGEVTVTAVPRRWRRMLRGWGVLERGDGVMWRSVHPFQAAGGEITQQLWPQPHPPCHPPPRPSSRQHLSGPSGGARQTASPLAWGQRHRVSRAGQEGKYSWHPSKPSVDGHQAPAPWAVGQEPGSLEKHGLPLHSKSPVRSRGEAGADGEREAQQQTQSPARDTRQPAHPGSDDAAAGQTETRGPHAGRDPDAYSGSRAQRY